MKKFEKKNNIAEVENSAETVGVETLISQRALLNKVLMIGVFVSATFFAIAAAVLIGVLVSKQTKVITQYIGSESKSTLQASYDLLHHLYNKPDDGIGSTVEITGVYMNSMTKEDGTVSEPVDGQKVYHFLVVYDDYGDCNLPVEFTTSNDNYPEVGSLIKITGEFKSYTEDGVDYYTVECKDYITEENESSGSDGTSNAESEIDSSEES